ncbi:MAG: hypothetical protein KJZ85_08670 [Rhodobacteraceae bacterium]|jgi:hypothetical protein|nr:hypothetical protein [Paracoccaceae bacterium]
MLRNDRTLRIAAIVAAVFGIATVAAGGLALRGAVDMGAVVPFVLWFNFLAGFAYLAAAAGLAGARRWGAWAAAAILAATAVALAVFGVHVLGGGAWEVRTAGAMALRVAVWATITWVAFRPLRPAG